MGIEHEELSVDQWVAEEIARLQRFAAWWAKGTLADAEVFPAMFPCGEWDEQYRCFTDED